MQFKQYPSYKNSGVEWLGGVPEHWVGSKFKYIFQEKQHTKNMNLPFGAISFGSVVYKEDKANLTDELKENYQEVLQGEFLVNPLNLNYDLKSLRTALSKIDVVVSSGYFVLKLKNNTFNKRYLEYLLYIFDIRKMKTLGAGIRQTLTFRDMAVCDVAIPSACEQTQIASFLDYETFRIDNLIAKQEKLIELLEEQRKSIISHAVTKGLNPNAPMKDSGVEWLGEVPNDWNLSRLDAVSKIVRGNSAFSKMDLLESGKYVALQYGKTYKVNEINESFGSYVNQEFFKKSQITEFGDIILISTSETLEDLGHSCFYARHDVGLIGGEQFLLKPKNQNFGKYIYYATKAFSSYLQRYATGLKVFRFNLDDLKKIYIPDISLVEQQKIAEFLDKETARIDISVLKQKSLIEKLKEYRASIISHAVTGKIDVREFGA